MSAIQNQDKCILCIGLSNQSLQQCPLIGLARGVWWPASCRSKLALFLPIPFLIFVAENEFGEPMPLFCCSPQAHFGAHALSNSLFEIREEFLRIPPKATYSRNLQAFGCVLGGIEVASQDRLGLQKRGRIQFEGLCKLARCWLTRQKSVVLFFGDFLHSVRPLYYWCFDHAATLQHRKPHGFLRPPSVQGR